MNDDVVVLIVAKLDDIPKLQAAVPEAKLYDASFSNQTVLNHLVNTLPVLA